MPLDVEKTGSQDDIIDMSEMPQIESELMVSSVS